MPKGIRYLHDVLIDHVGLDKHEALYTIGAIAGKKDNTIAMWAGAALNSIDRYRQSAYRHLCVTNDIDLISKVMENDFFRKALRETKANRKSNRIWAYKQGNRSEVVYNRENS